jgi:hypothetical protein
MQEESILALRPHAQMEESMFEDPTMCSCCERDREDGEKAGALRAALNEVDPTRIALELRTALSRGFSCECGAAKCAAEGGNVVHSKTEDDEEDDDSDEDWLDDDPTMALMLANRMAQLQTKAKREGVIEDSSEEVCWLAPGNGLVILTCILSL